MPKMQVTDAEAKLIKQERHRLALENRKWQDEPHVDDQDLMIMSRGFVIATFLSRPNEWIYSYCEHRYINVTHPGNMTWYMEYLMAKSLAGELPYDEIPERLRMSKVYHRLEGTDYEQLREYQTKTTQGRSAGAEDASS